MNSQEDRLSFLQGQIESQLNWGAAEEWSNKDFEELSERIAQSTSVNLSSTTLKRVWGRVAYTSQPSITTLDAIAQFAGHQNWRDFRIAERQSGEEVIKFAPQPTVEKDAVLNNTSPVRNADAKGNQTTWLLAAGIIILLLFASVFFYRTVYSQSDKAKEIAKAQDQDTPIIQPEDYFFDFRPVTTGVPNSVVFNYNATQAPTEEVYLQQSWDERRREKLAREQQYHTSIYYLPGYYRTKLVVNDQVVKERELYLRSQDWVAAVNLDPVPVYLPLDECRKKGRLAISESQLTELGLDLQPHPPRTILTHVGAIDNLWSDDFNFSTRLRHDYATGAGICQFARVLLLLKNGVIIIPLSAPGCVAELELYAGGKTFLGAENDLSAFGVVGDTWLQLACTGKAGLLTFSVNGRQIHQVESNEEPKEIIGIRYEFSGMGSVDDLRFSHRGETVWADDFTE